MKYIVTPEEMRQADYDTIIKLRVSERQLMEVAGKECFNIIQSRYPDFKSKKFLVVCGKGNNGGDGIVLSRFLASQDVSLDLVYLGNESELKQDNIQNLKSLRQFISLGTSLRIFEADEGIPEIIKKGKYDFIIDAILGTGYRKSDHPDGIKRTELNNPFLPFLSEKELEKQGTSIKTNQSSPKEKLVNEAIQTVNILQNLNRSIVISLDLPSGLDAKSGIAQMETVQATLTIALGYPKTGYFFADGVKLSGEIVCADIGITDRLLPKNKIKWVDSNFVSENLPSRNREANKTTGGKVLVIAGSQEVSQSQIGAAVLTALGAINSGASYICVSAPSSSFNIFHTQVPEAILIDQNPSSILDKAKWANAIVIGPGFGRSSEKVNLMADILKQLLNNVSIRKPLVIDGDALYTISEMGLLNQLNFENVILTPHHGEFAKLLGLNSNYIEIEKLTLSRTFVNRFKANLLLKGPTTVILSNEESYFVTNGNENLATAGTGDVLSGMIASFAAQGCQIIHAAAISSFIMGKAVSLVSLKSRYPSASQIAQSIGFIISS
ncbi:MAG: NAD(P)H-hydrate dehydratase [Chloroherpetonaceae bacterium]|nr:NAD(P)H-hydrate dehydratase [Chloroherpetonaceae bacterium]